MAPLEQFKMSADSKNVTDPQKEYKIIPVKFREENKSCHYIYYKLHQVRENNNRNTLFLLNVPPYCNEDCLKRLFSKCGKITSISFHQKPTSSLAGDSENSKYFSDLPRVSGFKVAYITFSKPQSVTNALKLKKTEPFVLSTEKNQITVGIKKWCKEYEDLLPDLNELETELKEFMEAYDKKEEEEKEAEKRKGDEPDEDGWITVTAHGKKKGIARTEHNIQKITRKEKKKRSQRELLNFYTFQIRESKMQHNLLLQKKFEEDKKRVALAKAARSFKPY